jgi:glycosyltransferase involved in cell wall biosynthesis
MYRPNSLDPSKKIVVLTREIVPFEYGGIGTHFRALNRFFRNRNHRVWFLTRKPQNYDADLYQQYYGDSTIIFTDESKRHPRLSNLEYARQAYEAFQALYVKIKPDILLSAEYGAEGFFIGLNRQIEFPDCRFVLTVQGRLRETIKMFEGKVKKKKWSALYRPDNVVNMQMEDICIRSFDEIITPSKNAWYRLCKELKVRKKATLIPNFISPSFQYQKTAPTGNDPNRVILFVGRLDRHKGADILLKAYILLSKETDIHLPELVFIGRDSIRRDYRMTFMDYWQDRIPDNIRNRIRIMGQLPPEEVRIQLESADFCVFPSRWEVFGIVCLEAMAAGCPVLVAKNTGLEELIGKRLKAWAVDVGKDESILAKKIKDLLEQGNVRRKYGAQFLQRANDIVETSKKAMEKFITKKQPRRYKRPNLDTEFTQLVLNIVKCLNS